MSPPLGRLARGALRRLAHRLAPPELSTALKFLRSEGGVAFPRRNVEVVAALPRARVLVLAPHPDDEAIGMGGTLAMHLAGGSEVTVLYLTDGGGPVEEGREELVRVRRAEAEALGRDAGVRQVFWDRPDTRLADDAATVQLLVALLRELRPELVYAPSLFDHHYDHFTTNQILADALAALPELEATVAGYEVWDNVPFPNWLVDVSAFVGRKEQLLAHYATPHRYTDFTRLCRQRSSVYYTLYVNSEIQHAEHGFAEAFLRFDAAAFRRLQAGYVAALRADRSELPRRLAGGGGRRA